MSRLSCCDSVEVFSAPRNKTSRHFARSLPQPKNCLSPECKTPARIITASPDLLTTDTAPVQEVIQAVRSGTKQSEKIILRLGKVRVEVKNAENLTIKEGENGELILQTNA